MVKIEDNNFALVLGGGAARGIVHVGVIKYLAELGLQPKVITGTSMGAIIGSLWAAGKSIAEIEKFVCSLRIRKFLDIDLLSRGGVIKGEKFEEYLHQYLGDITFSDLAIPLRVNATDFVTGDEVVFRQGLVVKAVRASMNIPGLFLPYRYQGRILVDGGVVNNLPISLARGFHFRQWVIVNPFFITDKLDSPALGSLNVWAVVERSLRLYALARYQREVKRLRRKVYLEYTNSQIRSYDFAKARDIIADGYKLAQTLIKA